MSNTLSVIEELRQEVKSADTLAENGFDILRRLSPLVGIASARAGVQEIILRMLEHRDTLGGLEPLMDALVREVGLFPYLGKETLPFRDRLAYEFHRPANMGDDIVFHGPQARIYRLLMAGESIALSAPMSFGKSLIIDALIASGKYNNVVIIVPTIALIDETRRRLSERFRGEYKIITHVSQARSTRNVYVLTQERVLEAGEFDDLDLFVIDEFYKLSPDKGDDHRSDLLNQAFYKLRKSCPQFYMLGPSVEALEPGVKEKIGCRFEMEPYHTVALNLNTVSSKAEGKLVTLMNLCRELDDPTLLFCGSPAKAATVALALVEAEVTEPVPELQEAADWVADYYHEDWHFVRALRRGIGVHHGRIPRALAQYVVRRFNEGTLPFLICTSTMIEGVNTKARNVVVYDKKIGKTEIDLFTFNNIVGRSGRMFQYFVGHVYLFYPPPQTELPLVDVPIYTQPEHAPDSLLVQIDYDDLTARSRERVNFYKEQEWLGFDTVIRNRGIDPEAQVKLARHIEEASPKIHADLAWRGMPNAGELRLACNLIWRFFDGRTLGASGAASAEQLYFRINQLRFTPAIRDLINDQKDYCGDADKAVQSILDFLKLWATFHFPRLLCALDLIQRDVLSRLGKQTGNYEVFAVQVENQFLDPSIIAVDEYGIPLELARKLEDSLATGGNLDLALDNLRAISPDALSLSDFEKLLITEAQAGL